MKLSAFIANTVYLLLNKKRRRSFERSVRNVPDVQKEYLLSLIKKNSATFFGKKFHFSWIQSIEDYQRNIPLFTYEDYKPYLDLIMEGESSVLTADPVLRLIFSSGTVSPSKLIPYTQVLQNEFKRGIGPWLYNIFFLYPRLKYGPSFWIVTPSGSTPQIKSSVAVGFDEDSSYFGVVEQLALKVVMAVPDIVSRISNPENYFYIVGYFLLKSQDLRFISIWNPSILPIILKTIIRNSDQLLNDIKNGTLTPPHPLTEKEKALLANNIQANSKRANCLREVFAEFGKDHGCEIWERVWSKLDLISCWTDGWAEEMVPEIKRLFPHTQVQGKGLLATEAFVSFPYASKNNQKKGASPVLAVESHFFEFQNVSGDDIFLAHQLKIGNRYKVIVTTGGGLYRYQLNDIVEVTGYYQQSPRIKFIGKTDVVSDIMGEKLNEIHVGKIIKGICNKFQINSSLTFLSPKILSGNAKYILFLRRNVLEPNHIDVAKVKKELDNRLRENFHYNYCRNIGQLKSPGIFLMDEEAEKKYLHVKSAGKKSGTIKFIKLDKMPGWDEILSGQLL